MDLCSTYIDGFDPLVGGGFTRGSVVLVSGGPGTGKTIFGLQFLYNGAMHAEPGLFLCTESTPDALRQEGASLGYDLQKLEQIDKIRFLQLPFDRSKFSFLRDVADEARKIGAKRIVFDSLATMYIRLGRFLPLWGRETDLIADQSTQAAERIIETMNKMAVSHSIIEQLRAIGTTTLVSTFGSNDPGVLSSDGASEYLSDSVVQLFNLPIGIKYERSIRIVKLKNAASSQYMHRFEITPKGILVEPLDML